MDPIIVHNNEPFHDRQYFKLTDTEMIQVWRSAFYSATRAALTRGLVRTGFVGYWRKGTRQPQVQIQDHRLYRKLRIGCQEFVGEDRKAILKWLRD